MAGQERDVFQERYEAHQANKRSQLAPQGGETDWKAYTPEEAATFFGMLENRSSQRVYNASPVTEEEMAQLAEAMARCPSSCNRQAIFGRVITGREDKEFLSGLLVGGVGWSHRADKLVLLFADMRAYKSPVEQDFMPYLDAGAMIMTMYGASEMMGIGAAYINPNIRDANKAIFDMRFGGENLRFCGAMALGHYDTKAAPSPRRPAREVWLR